MMKILFWLSLTMVFYAYAGYPLLLLLWPFKKKTVRSPVEPPISVLIAVRNEARVIAEKVRHLQEMDYPDRLRQVIVVSDGSTDDTLETLSALPFDPQLTVLHYNLPMGKAYALNLAAAKATGDILVFNDARQKLAPGAVRALLSNFADPAVGCASGELRFYTEGQPGRKATLYWKFERWLRAQESLLGCCIGATGAFYAIRRECFQPLPEGLILDDVFTPLQIALRGYRVIHDPQAVVFDHEAPTEQHEFRRKVRTLSGNYQLLRYLPGLFGFRLIGFQFFSHKFVRLLVPLFLLLCLVSSLLAGGWFYRMAFFAQLACYGVAIFGMLLGTRAPAWAAAPAGVVVLNSAALVAMLNFFRGKTVTWNK
jgi:cellulose synthase/poly-beta-1,6-N-acetylglucosamine synthase-like glycosyltransferase